MKISRHLGFTLVEILVVIAIISILALGSSQINWNSLTDRQKSTQFSHTLKNTIESVRNDSLMGKGINNSLDHAYSWKITLSKGGTGTLTTSYNTSPSGSFINYSLYSIANKELFKISKIECLQLDGTQNEELDSDVSLLFTGGDISIDGCSDANSKILQFETTYKQFKETFSFNVVSGIIED